MQVQSELIANSAITGPKLATASVDSSKIGDGSVATADLADGAVTPQKMAQALTSMTVQAATSGTSRDFTGIPAWARKIRVMLNGVSLSGTALIRFQLGTSGGVVSTGYLGAGSVISSGVATVNQTAGFEIYTNVPNAAYVYHGVIDFSLLDAASNVWVANGVFATSSVAWTHTVSGVITLASALTQVRITTSNGTDTFDAGSINVLYE